MMKLVRGINSTYNEVNRNLEILEAEDIIKNDYRRGVKHARVRVVRLNKENPRTRRLLQVLQLLEDETSS